jgi:hypothetical protein
LAGSSFLFRGNLAMKLSKATDLVALLMLLAFLSPYIYKLKQIDITLVLIGGALLAIYDFISSKD